MYDISINFIHKWSFSLKSKMFIPHTRYTKFWGLNQRKEHPKCLALKTNRVYVQEKHRAIGNKYSTLKGSHTDTLVPGPSKKAAV